MNRQKIIENLMQIIESKRNGLAKEAEYAKEEVRLIQTLKECSKDEIITLSCVYLRDYLFATAIGNIKNKIMEDNSKFLKEISQDYGKEYKKLAKQAVKMIKERDKKLDYLENILAQKKNKKNAVLDIGRIKANKKRKDERDTLAALLKDAIKHYLMAHTEHKVTNKELEAFLGKAESGFIGKNTYKESTFKKRVAELAAEVRRELLGQ